MEKDIGDRPHSGQPATAAMMETKDEVNGMIQDDCCVTTSELLTKIGIGKLVMAIIRVLGCRTFCTVCAMKTFTIEHKTYMQNFVSMVRKMDILFC